MNQRSAWSRAVWPFVVLLPLLVACSDDDEPETPDVLTSTVEGRLELATFVAPPTGVDAIDEVGTRTNAGLAPDGAFKLELRKDHDYKLVALSPQGEVPIVFPRNAGLPRGFRIDDGNVVVALGAIRAFPKQPDGGITTRTGAATDPAACAFGKVPGTETACVEEALGAVCAPGVRVDVADPDDDDDDDRPAPSIDQADPNLPFAVPERNAPAIAEGCDD